MSPLYVPIELNVEQWNALARSLLAVIEARKSQAAGQLTAESTRATIGAFDAVADLEPDGEWALLVELARIGSLHWPKHPTKQALLEALPEVDLGDDVDDVDDGDWLAEQVEKERDGAPEGPPDTEEG